ncbi:MAG: sulfotransferase [Parvularculaceae bacterium]|nr:sulfotransferase [Parvularculaceae bacterium]
MAHPLAGADLGTLSAVLGRAGTPHKHLKTALILAAATFRAPISFVEEVVMDEKLPKLEEMDPPVFILGHWRSGTTHLYNIMVKSGAWGYVPPIATGLPWDLFGIARVFRPWLERALPEHRYIDKIPVTPDSPQEDEIAIANMSPLSFYHGIYFPKAFAQFLGRGLFFDGCTPREIDAWRARFVYFMRKLYLHQARKPLLIKNPVYTGRLALLREIFPEAKFVHIHRNPYQVFLSMRNFYGKLLDEFALQRWDHLDIDEAILSTYVRMMTALEKDAADMPADRYIEIRYDELDREPLETVREIYRALYLPGFDLAAPRFSHYIASVKSFEKNNFAFPEDAARKVEARLGRFIRKWGYQRPGATLPSAPSVGLEQAAE